jgi:hypothetical protein
MKKLPRLKFFENKKQLGFARLAKVTDTFCN